MAKVFLQSFKLPSVEDEFFKLTDGDKIFMYGVYDGAYPFGFFKKFINAPRFEFAPITILYGSNGSGKSTVLNIIAEKIKLSRNSPYNRTDYFDDFCDICNIEAENIPYESKIITSDDIFRKLSNVRLTNDGIDGARSNITKKKAELSAMVGANPDLLRFKGLDSYDEFAKYYEATNSSKSKYIRERLQKNIKEASNGETAIEYLTNEITENALYLLDEPENSLAPKLQLELKQFIEDSARFYNCQFIIASHSPLLLSLNGARIYNFDSKNADICKWNELENVKVLAEFFKEHSNEF